MRQGELAGLCWDRVDFASNVITVTRTRDRNGLKERSKNNIIRTIAMTTLIRATLLKLSEKRVSSNFVFLECDGEPIDPHHIYRVFEKPRRVPA